MTPKLLGPVHPSIPTISAACDALLATIWHELAHAEDADRLHAQIEGAIERLQVLSALALERANELTGRA